MKIAFDHQTFCLQGYGGISRYIVRLAEQLNKSNDVGIFAGLHQNHYLQGLPKSMIWGKKITYPRRGILYLSKFNGILTHGKIKEWQADIVHQTYYRDLYSYKKPTIITVHDMIHELYRNEFSPNELTPEFKRKSIQNASHIIAISESTKKDLMEILGIEESKISVIYHGFDRFDIGQLTNPIHQKPYLLYVGHRGGYKNFENLVQAFVEGGLMNDFDLVAFGGGGWTTAEKSLFEQLKIPEQSVRQLGGGDDVLANLYRHATAFVYPSRYEGFGIPPLEAMAQNCPVISSNASSIPEVVGDAGYYFDPNDVEDMLESIRKVVYDDELSTQLIMLGNERLKLFSWEKCARQTEQVYQKVVR